jgi:hypothetical protein
VLSLNNDRSRALLLEPFVSLDDDEEEEEAAIGAGAGAGVGAAAGLVDKGSKGS